MLFLDRYGWVLTVKRGNNCTLWTMWTHDHWVESNFSVYVHRRSNGRRSGIKLCSRVNQNDGTEAEALFTAHKPRLHDVMFCAHLNMAEACEGAVHHDESWACSWFFWSYFFFDKEGGGKKNCRTETERKEFGLLSYSYAGKHKENIRNSIAN